MFFSGNWVVNPTVHCPVGLVPTSSTVLLYSIVKLAEATEVSNVINHELSFKSDLLP